MSGYSPDDEYWRNQSGGGYASYNFSAGDSANFGQGNEAELNFQDTSQYENVANASYFDPRQPFYNNDGFNTTGNFQTPNQDDYEDEPPLLEELGVDPDRIVEKTLAVLNPFHKQGLVDDVNFLTKDTDLAGPLVFCMALGAILLVSGGKANFSYVYGNAVTGCILMYFLLSLMNTSGAVTLTSVASILGYCLLPVVVLSVVAIFFSLTSIVGIALCLASVTWCSLSASRLFVTLMASDCSQRPLVAYPCMLLYSVFVLIVIF